MYWVWVFGNVCIGHLDFVFGTLVLGIVVLDLFVFGIWCRELGIVYLDIVLSRFGLG